MGLTLESWIVIETSFVQNSVFVNLPRVFPNFLGLDKTNYRLSIESNFQLFSLDAFSLRALSNHFVHKTYSSKNRNWFLAWLLPFLKKNTI